MFEKYEGLIIALCYISCFLAIVILKRSDDLVIQILSGIIMVVDAMIITRDLDLDCKNDMEDLYE